MQQRGQVLPLFALGLLVILVVAALAFDVGMVLVERRDQQNAADAAAIAAARYLPTDENKARAAAYSMAALNGFTSGAADAVTVHIPPVHGVFRGMPGHIEVEISSTRPSIFAGVIGRASWPISTYAVAANISDLVFSVGMLALNETACKAIHVAGNGYVYVNGDIQSNSSGSGCPEPPYGFSRTGGGTITVTAPDGVCRSVGEIQDQGSGDLNCDPEEYRFALPDPLRNLPAVPKPALAAPILRVGHTTDIPDYCPGAANAGRQPSESSPRLCTIGQGSAESGKQWVLSPGLYPGGVNIKGDSTIFMLPGIYWIGGGGFAVAGDSDVYSVASATDLTPGGGVLLYNSRLPGAGGAPGPITLGGSGARLYLKPLAAEEGSPDATYNGLVVFQDRTVTSTVTLNGSQSIAEVRGIVYVPAGQVTLNGSDGAGTDSLAHLTVDQVIADTFLVDGKGGTINVLRETGVDIDASAAGLVE